MRQCTRLAHLYDNAPIEVRRRIGRVDSKRYSLQALEILESKTRWTSPAEEIDSGYLAGWLRHDIGDEATARTRMSEAVRIAQRETKGDNELLIPTAVETSLAFEMAVQSLFFSNEPDVVGADPLLPDYLKAHGLITSCEEMISLGHRDKIGRKSIPSKISTPSDVWHIVFNRYDFASATMIGSRLLFDWNRPVELICVPDKCNVEALLEQCKGRRIVLGGPDSPGPVGALFRRKFPNIAKLWQLRFNESFYQPVLLTERPNEAPTILLTASIAGDILRAWMKFVLEIEPVRPNKERPMDLAMVGSVLPTILTTASKKLTELFIDRLVKSVEKRLDAKNQRSTRDELADVKWALEDAASGRDAAEVRRKLANALSPDTQSRIVLTGLIDEMDNRTIYAGLEALLGDLPSTEHSTNYFCDMAALLQTLSLSEHQRLNSNLEAAKKARNFADGFSNLKSRLAGIIEDYETKAKWDVESRNIAVNDLVVTANRFFRFVQSEA